MRRYMRNKFEFFGIASAQRTELQHQLVSTVKEVETAFDLAEALWEYEERECQYTACDLLRRVVARKNTTLFGPHELLHRAQALILSKSWWDTVDTLAPNVVGIIAHRSEAVNVEQVATSWIEHPNFWVQRSAIIMQLRYKQDTNARLLFRLILAVAHNPEFFLRKSAGWALREYSKVNPRAVREFVDEHAGVLSALTVREGTKYC